MQNKNSQLRYFMTESHHSSKNCSVLIVALIGRITEENSHILRECRDLISSSASGIVILSFKKVQPQLDAASMFWLAELKEALRVRSAVLRIFSPEPSIKKLLESKRIIERHEIAPTLAEALASIPDAVAAA